jgi:hypothetical protein
MQCPGSVGLSQVVGIDREGDNFPADEGTAAHLILERCLRDDRDAFEFCGDTVIVGENKTEILVDDEMMLGVQEALDTVRSLVTKDTVLHTEKTVQYANHDDAWGTADVILFGVRHGVLTVIDFKYGKAPVEAEANPQLLCGAAGVRRMLEESGSSKKVMVKYVDLIIIQPRVAMGKTIKYAARIDRKQLLAWEKKTLAPAVRAVFHKKPKYATGEHCTYCPALVNCPTFNAETKEIVEVTEINVPARTDGSLVRIYEKAALVRKLLYAVEDELRGRLNRGVEVEGVKLVEGKGSRGWKDDAERDLVDVYGDDAYTTAVLRSPAQIDKLPGGKALAKDLAVRSVGKPVLALASDKRPAISRNAADVFGEHLNKETEK